MNRTALGIAVVILLVAGTIMMIVPDWDTMTGGVLLRAGLMLGAVWLVLPRARELSGTTWLGIGIFAAVLVARPRLVLWGLAVGGPVSLLGLRTRNRAGGTGGRTRHGR